MTTDTSERGRAWRRILVRARPVPATPASRRLRRLIALTAAAVVVVEAINLQLADEPGFGLFVRTMWALLRVIGFLVLMRAVRYGRAAARPFGLILAATTIFAVARVTTPRDGGLLPAAAVVIGFAVLALLCAAMVWMLFRSRAIQAHFATRPVRRHVPGWVLTVRVTTLAYGALLVVPLLVALGTVAGEHARQPWPVSVTALAVWFALVLAAVYVAPVGSFFVVMGRRWARWLIGAFSLAVLVAQPLLCFALLGIDGLLRDGVPMIVTALLGLYALHRSRGQPTWVRQRPVTPDGSQRRPAPGGAPDVPIGAA